MANNELQIRLVVKDEMSKQLNQAKGRMSKFNKVGVKGFADLAAKVYLAEKAIRVFGGALKGVITALVQTGSKVEDLGVRMNVLLGSAEAGNKVFEEMAVLAGKVPKTYDEIMESATQLAGVVKDGTKEISQLMPIIVDISAASGIGVQEVTGQIIRMYSAGAASADMFRERGISAALGFQAGVSYTNKETMDILTTQWEQGFGKFVGASNALATTFTGMSSMMSDAWFTFKVDVGAALFEQVKLDMGAVLTLINKSKEEGGEYKQVVEDLSLAIESFAEFSLNAFFAILVASGHVRDIWNELILLIHSLTEGFIELEIASTNAAMLTSHFVGMNEAVGLASERVFELTLALEELRMKDAEIFLDSEIDHSTLMETRLEGWKKMLTKQRKLDQENAKIQTKADAEGNKKKVIVETMFHKWRSGLYKQGGDDFKKMQEGKLDNLKSTLSAASGLHKGFAQAAAAIQMVEAVINTAGAVTKGLNTSPFFPVGIAMGALAAAMGAIQIATIASANFAEGTDSVPAMLTPGEMIVPRTFSDAIRSGDLTLGGGGAQSGGGSNINIEINNPVVQSENDINELVEEISRLMQFESERIA